MFDVPSHVISTCCSPSTEPPDVIMAEKRQLPPLKYHAKTAGGHPEQISEKQDPFYNTRPENENFRTYL